MLGFVIGNPSSWPFDHWISQSPNIIVAVVYYRLDSFGFLSTPAFADESLGDLNAGLLDQMQALRWIKANIGAFGGDPRSVTINGQSAGGAAVELLLVANVDEELFQAGIVQSPFRVAVATPKEQAVG
jgi:carboxylesterase type B